MSPITSISLDKFVRPVGAILSFVSVAFMAVSFLSIFSANLAAADQRSENPKTIIFVCIHGSVKSQMAAAHFNQIASERGLPFVAVSRAITADDSIPAKIRDGLASEGLTPANDVPSGLTAEEASHAVKVLAFDQVPIERSGDAKVTYWSDVPPATKNYNAARDAIVRHINDLVPSLTSQ